MDLQDKPGGRPLFCTSLSCCHRLHEEILPAHPAVFIDEAQSGWLVHELRSISSFLNKTTQWCVVALALFITPKHVNSLRHV